MNIPLSQITSTLSVFMGSEYINDFDYNNRAYRVFVQADQPFRMNARDLHSYYVRSDSGQMIPLDNLVAVTRVPDRRSSPITTSSVRLKSTARRRAATAPARDLRPWRISPRRP